jgi:hypothetical protein
VFDEIKNKGGVVPEMKDYDEEGKPTRVYQMVEPCEASPDIPEV